MTPTLSVETVHKRFIWEVETGVATRLAGTEGAVISEVEVGIAVGVAVGVGVGVG